MTAVESLPTPRPSAPPPVSDPRHDVPPALCPYLATIDGTWRSASAVREHRCMAVAPPAQLAPEKQRRLCLVAEHVNCATYGAAIATRPGPAGRLAGHSRPLGRMTPVLLDKRRFELRLPNLGAERASGQAILVGLLVIAFVAILVARPSGVTRPPGALASDVSPTSVPSGLPTDAAGESPVDSRTLSPSPHSTTEPAASAAPTVGQPTVRPSLQPATSGATYKVKSGDTLSAIAARFGTTVRVLVDLNGITDPSKLKVGQVLLLP